MSSSSATANVAAPSAPPALQIRALTTTEDCNACVELQREVWGFGQGDVVPATLLHVVEYVGGIAAGAFDEQGALVGFVFGISGIHDGQVAHWSHMLGVRESARNLGVGRMLKEYQRQRLAELGIAYMYWTFDPLQAKNAHFNLNRLGARVVDYVPDMYGTTGSPLHLGLPTDRLVVRMSTAARSNGASSNPVVDVSHSPIRTPFPRAGDARVDGNGTSAPVVRLEMPLEVPVSLDASSDSMAWRMSLREGFQWALASGYEARGVSRDAATGRMFYVMVNGASDSTR